MTEEYPVKPVAVIRSDFEGKFGIPRQSGIADALRAEIVFEDWVSDREVLRGIEGFSHLWLIWRFSGNADRGWSPTVRPPRLGGNERKGVFATRSPFRPNCMGLSCVRLVSVNDTGKGMPTLTVAGADLMDGTPIFDIKPYVPYTDCVPDATGGFAPDSGKRLRVEYADGVLNVIPADKRAALDQILSLDPRPQYKRDGEQSYGMDFAGINLHFTVENEILTVIDAVKK